MKPGGTPANQHPILTTCIQNTTCAGDQLRCCFDQGEADQMNLWEAILGFLCLGNEFQGFLGGSRCLFWEHFRVFCLQMLFVYLFMFLCILGYNFKRNVSLTTLSYDVIMDAVMAEEEAIMMLRCMFD